LAKIAFGEQVAFEAHVVGHVLEMESGGFESHRKLLLLD